MPVVDLALEARFDYRLTNSNSDSPVIAVFMSVAFTYESRVDMHHNQVTK